MHDNIPEEYNQYKRKLSTTSILRRKNYRLLESTGHRYHAPALKTPRHQQDDDGTKTLLVADALRSDSKKVRQLHTV